MNKNIFSSDVQFISTNRMIGEDIKEFTIKVAFPDEARNGTLIPRSVLEEAASKTLPGTPIVGFYDWDEEDFLGHESELTVTKRGLEITPSTRPYGFVPLDAEVRWEREKETGRDFIVTNGYLWTGRYPELERMLDGRNRQSMELSETKTHGEWAIDPQTGERTFIVSETAFSALCILGEKVAEAFQGASFSPVLNFSEMDNLRLALQFSFDDSRLPVQVVSLDTEEQKEAVEKAMKVLDEAAEKEPDKEAKKALKEGVDSLLEVEDKLDVEDVVVANNNRSAKVLANMVGGEGDILSSPTFNEKATPITSPFKDKEERDMEDTNMEETDTLEEKKKRLALANISDTELIDILLDRIKTAEEMKEILAGLSNKEEGDKEMEEKKVSTDFVDEEEKKEEDELEEEVKDLEEGQEEEEMDKEEDKTEEEEKEEEEKKKEEDTKDFSAPGDGIKQKDKETGKGVATPAVPKDSVRDSSETEEGDNPSGTPADVSSPDLSGPEGSKDNPGVTKDFEKEAGELASKVLQYEKKVEELEEELDELRKFKKEQEDKEKEETLKQFALLSEEDKESVRLEFSQLTKEEVEAKCALMYYRQGLMESGQKDNKDEPVLSYSLGEGSADPVPEWVKAVKATI